MPDNLRPMSATLESAALTKRRVIDFCRVASCVCRAC
jgi:hypothetical protein